jgi:hypothetical protein
MVLRRPFHGRRGYDCCHKKFGPHSCFTRGHVGRAERRDLHTGNSNQGSSHCIIFWSSWLAMSADPLSEVWNYRCGSLYLIQALYAQNHEFREKLYYGYFQVLISTKIHFRYSATSCKNYFRDTCMTDQNVLFHDLGNELSTVHFNTGYIALNTNYCSYCMLTIMKLKENCV